MKSPLSVRNPISNIRFQSNLNILLLLFSSLTIFSPLFSQQKNWAIYQSDNSTANVSFEATGPILKTATVLPLNPHTNYNFTDFLALNSQTDKLGNLLFYLISTADSVYLFNSQNSCVEIFPVYDISPLIIPVPGGIKYHIVVGGNLYDLDLKTIQTSIYGDVLMRNRSPIPLSRLSIGPENNAAVGKRSIKILKNHCDTFIYRIFSISANNIGYTGRNLVATDIITTYNNFNSIQSDTFRIDAQQSTDLDFNYSISEMELSEDQNELLVIGRNCLLRIDVSTLKFGNIYKNCFPFDTSIYDTLNYLTGAEYLNDSLILTTISNYYNDTSSSQGLYVYNKNSNLFKKVSNSIDFRYSYIERGNDERLYLLKSDGLFYYDINNDSIIKSISLSPIRTYPFLNDKTKNEIDTSFRIYYLPNQIDFFENTVLEDKNALVDHVIIKSPPNQETNYFSNANHTLTPKGKGDVIVFDSLIISNISDWVVFDSMTIKFYENASLKIIGGADLVLKGTKLMATCGDMWKGVEILQNDNQESKITCIKNAQGNRTLIRDAITAIKTRNSYHSVWISDSTIFTANENGLELNNADSYSSKISNTFFLDTAPLNNNQKTNSGIFIKNSTKLSIGNNDSFPNYIIGGEQGIIALNNKKISVVNTHIIETPKHALKIESNDDILVENCKILNCGIDKNAKLSSSIYVNSFKNLVIRKNKIYSNLSRCTGIEAICFPTSHLKIGGEIVDSNRIDIVDGTGILCKIEKSNLFTNSKSQTFEILGRPFIFQIPVKQTIQIENNCIRGSSNANGINVHYENANNNKYLLDTLFIHKNKILGGTGIKLINFRPTSLIKFCPCTTTGSMG